MKKRSITFPTLSSFLRLRLLAARLCLEPPFRESLRSVRFRGPRVESGAGEGLARASWDSRLVARRSVPPVASSLPRVGAAGARKCRAGESTILPSARAKPKFAAPYCQAPKISAPLAACKAGLARVGAMKVHESRQSGLRGSECKRDRAWCNHHFVKN